MLNGPSEPERLNKLNKLNEPGEPNELHEPHKPWLNEPGELTSQMSLIMQAS